MIFRTHSIDVTDWVHIRLHLPGADITGYSVASPRAEIGCTPARENLARLGYSATSLRAEIRSTPTRADVARLYPHMEVDG